MGVTDYTDLLTSQHSDKPRFVASIEALLQPLVETQAELLSMPLLYDIDTAVGDQLDKIGEWVGQTRYLTVEIPGLFFSFDTPGLGFDEGFWKTPEDDASGLIVVPDDQYRLVLKAKVLNNHWDGSIPSAYAIFDKMFEGTGIEIAIKDHGDLTMTMIMRGGTPDGLTQALFEGGLIKVKPAGVRVLAYTIEP